MFSGAKVIVIVQQWVTGIAAYCDAKSAVTVKHFMEKRSGCFDTFD
jgi:hypothetical protein